MDSFLFLNTALLPPLLRAAPRLRTVSLKLSFVTEPQHFDILRSAILLIQAAGVLRLCIAYRHSTS